MNISVKKLYSASRMPTYAHPHDAGMDLYSCEDITIASRERRAVGTGVALEIPEGYVGLVWDKSGRALHDGLSTLAGVVDASYRGEIKVVLLNCTDHTVIIAAGEKIAQMLIQPVVHATLFEVRELSETLRGDGGFGSTGVS